MAQHETKNCQRCDANFECKVGNITQCQCYGFSFNDKEKDYIYNNYNDCLCRKCLGSIKHEVRYSGIKNKMLSILSIFKK